MSEIPKETVDRMMVKCGRRCCICRRFNPTKLQVHHIVERSQGGKDDEDNLIVSCVTCHIDVHSTVPFTRRFSDDELKGHRDSLIRLVESGAMTEDAGEQPLNITIEIVGQVAGELELSPEAAEILLHAAETKDNRQGIIVARDAQSFSLFPGAKSIVPSDRRRAAAYRSAISQLESAGLIESTGQNVWQLTYAGFLKADELAAVATAQASG